MLASLLAALTLAAPSPYLIRDLTPAPGVSSLRVRDANLRLAWDPWLGVLPAGALFEAVGEDGRLRLWASDGTAAETVPLAAVDAYAPRVAGDQLFFLVRPDGRASGLWRSDGSAAGTGPVPLPSVPDTSPAPLGVLGGRLLFANDYGGGGRELWISDGSAAGTTSLIDPAARPSTNPEDVVVLGARAVFTATGDAGRELWATDGTIAGTGLVADLTPGAPGSFVVGGGQFHRLGARALFAAAGRLWRSDGTPAGTVPLADLGAARLAAAFVAAERLFFVPEAAPPALWASDGTAAGTGPVAPGVRAPRVLGAVAGSALFFASDGEGEALWASDGSAAGTRRLGSLRADRARALTAACVDAYCVFAADDGAHGSEPWRSDGSAAGTALLLDLRPGDDSSHPYGFAVAGGRVAFLADDGVHGIEPWITTGAPGRARLVADINPGAPSSGLGLRDETQPLLLSGGRLLLGADDGRHGREPWAIPLAALTPSGDCDDDGAVTIGELVRAVAIALGEVPLAACPAADRDADGAVVIDELIAAVAAALDGAAP